MPKGPQGQKRPADVIGAAVKVMRIATGEETEEQPKPKSAAAELGARGGRKRAETLSPEQRAEVAAKGAKARWANKSHQRGARGTAVRAAPGKKERP